MSKDKRQQLLDFINKKAFDVVINASPDKYSEEDRGALEDIQRKTKNEKKQFENGYTTAEKVKSGFPIDVGSKLAAKLNKELEHLGLPTLPGPRRRIYEAVRKDRSVKKVYSTVQFILHLTSSTQLFGRQLQFCIGMFFW